MQKVSGLLLGLLLASAAAGQVTTHQFTSQELAAISRVCGASLVRAGSEHDMEISAFNRLTAAMREKGWGQRAMVIALTDSPQVNAFTHPSQQGRGGGLICLPIAMVRFLQDSDAELAAVIAHEMGHAIDDGCRRVWQSRRLEEQRMCEKRADEIGFLLLVQAGYNPFAVAGAFGRLEMFSGDYSTGFLARFRGLAQNHPITPDRIADMRRMVVSYCGQNPEACR